MKRSHLCLGSAVFFFSACGDSTAPTVKGIDVEEGPCGHALVVVDTDYGATSIRLVSFEGAVLAHSILSSGSAKTGLSAPLSGDVVVPSSRTSDGIVLVDRTLGVITFLDPVEAKVTRQISVGGETNPHDYLQVAEGKAYVSRFDTTAGADASSLDHGGDVAVIDLDKGKVTSRIDFSEAVTLPKASIYPHPNRMLTAKGKVYVLSPLYSANYKESGDSFVAEIDPATDELERTVSLKGLADCLGFAVSPDESTLVAACSGTFAGQSNGALGDGGVAIVDVASLSLTGSAPAKKLGEPLGFNAAFASARTVIFTTTGDLDTNAPDQLWTLDLDSLATRKVLASEAPFDFSDVRCAPQCGNCFLTDVGYAGGTVVRFPVSESGELGAPTPVADKDAALPARLLGAY